MQKYLTFALFLLTFTGCCGKKQCKSKTKSTEQEDRVIRNDGFNQQQEDSIKRVKNQLKEVN